MQQQTRQEFDSLMAAYAEKQEEERAAKRLVEEMRAMAISSAEFYDGPYDLTLCRAVIEAIDDALYRCSARGGEGEGTTPEELHDRRRYGAVVVHVDWRLVRRIEAICGHERITVFYRPDMRWLPGIEVVHGPWWRDIDRVASAMYCADRDERRGARRERSERFAQIVKAYVGERQPGGDEAEQEERNCEE